MHKLCSVIDGSWSLRWDAVVTCVGLIATAARRKLVDDDVDAGGKENIPIQVQGVPSTLDIGHFARVRCVVNAAERARS
jgi:hypothetical protein